MEQRKTERLQKFMAEAWVASRRASEELIRQGCVLVNGTTATLGMSVDPEHDVVLCHGKRIVKQQVRTVIVFYKPRGVVCTASDPEGRKTVQDFFSELPERLYNVGRLDLNSEGLLLMTNDGALANRLMHPRYGVEKTYRTVCDGKLTASEIALLTNGIELEDGMTAPARVENVRTTQKGDTAFSITIHEGRNRQVRRMVEAVGHRTLRLKRERFGPLTLGELQPGQWRRLTEEEIRVLERKLGL